MSGIVGSYFNTRGSGVVAKLGTDGQVFTSTGAGLTQGFEDAAGGGAWTLIKNVTASNDSAISFIHGTSSVVVDSTYPTYAIIIRNLTPATDTQDLFFRYSQGGSIITTAKYSFHTDGGGSNVAAGTGNSNADNQDRMSLNGQDMQALDNDAASSFDMTMIISNPSGSTTRTNCYWHCSYSDTNASVHGRSGHGSYVNDSTAVDGFSFYMQSGNITTGTFSLYGISN
tara:strand:- start:260 stop:940 length:681 start_codon:yes stop_codon:yes gene_type:complete